MKKKTRFEVRPGSKLPGFEIFVFGKIAGVFRSGLASVDVVLNQIGDAEQLVELVDWFIEVAKLKKTPLRFTRIQNPELFERLVSEFGFQKSHTDTVIKYDFLYAAKI